MYYTDTVVMINSYKLSFLYYNSIFKKGLSWPWSYCSWIYNYLCNQCLSPLMLWVRISIRARCPHKLYHIIMLYRIYYTTMVRVMVFDATFNMFKFELSNNRQLKNFQFGNLYHLRLWIECTLFCNLQNRERTSLSPIRRGFAPGFVGSGVKHHLIIW
jgi:hypothetical protein